MKRLLLCSILLAACLAPSRALAFLLPGPWYAVFTFTADPLDPLGGTSTGWYYIQKTDLGQRPSSNDWDLDFWWQAHHWTEENTVGTVWADWVWYDPFSYWIDGGGEEEFQWGNSLDGDFDFEIRAGANSPTFGTTYAASMLYVNPTASQFGYDFSRSGPYHYVATGSWYITDQQPPAASPPGIPEPSSLALSIIGLGAMVASRRKRSDAPEAWARWGDFRPVELVR